MRYLLSTLWLVLILCISASAATITVTNTNDSGAGSLRQAIASAAAGDLDPTFGNGGKVVDWPGQLSDVVIQADGKIVATGTLGNGYAVARYNPNGSIDTTFGGGTGKATAAAISEFIYVHHVSAAIQPDGKIVISGVGYVGNMGYCTMEVFRLNADGSFDAFYAYMEGGGGYIYEEDFVNNTVKLREYNSVQIQADGKIIVDYGGGLYRLNQNGSRDATFGVDGLVELPIIALTSALQSDGKILAAGHLHTDTTAYFGDNDFSVVRHNVNGVRDATFGTGGLVTTGDGFVYCLAVQADGKIIAGGTKLVRYNTNGSLDTSFGSGGTVIPPTTIADIAIQPDGKIAATGSLNGDFALLRYNANGALDTTFGGGDGIATTDFNHNDNNDSASGVALDGAGRAVVVGVAGGFYNQQFALARFLLGDTSQIECSYLFSANSSSFSVKGGTGGFDLTTNDVACSWTANSNVGWITINSGAGTGGGSVTFTVSSNTGKGARSGTINVGSQILTVNQDASGSRKRGR